MSYLALLNIAQLKAVQHPPSIPLQILAGPGSGKTKVLTCRIAHLIQHHGIYPSSICAVTFTNKAANEMRERLNKLIGKDQTVQIHMGTFHSLCAGFLRRYPKLVGLEGNFTVCDADESKKIITSLQKPYEQELAAKNITMKAATIMSLISKAKAKGLSPDEYLECEESAKKDPNHAVVAAIYKDYAKALRTNNSLDFDDLLCFGVKLFEENEKVADWCEHVLVDEFQDTNGMQYQLMKFISAKRKRVTIVGDPDQSIYGWRSAEIANLGKMCKDFPTTEKVLLEQNYRSTQSILAVSLAIVSQDKARIPKLLHSSHPPGPPPLLFPFPNEHAESSFIAAELKRLVAHMGGMLNWNDFVVLLRFNALSRTIESALQKEGIPSRVLGGHKFFDRLEVKDLLAYLQLVDNDQFLPAFRRIINVPPRGIGEKTVKAVLTRATELKISPLAVVEQIYDDTIADTKPSIKKKIKSFVTPIRKLREMANEEATPRELLLELLDLVDYEAHLKKSQQDWESRWENVLELLTFATEVCTDLEPERLGTDTVRVTVHDKDWVDPELEVEFEVDADNADVFDVIDLTSDDDKKGVKEEDEEKKPTPLRSFLQASMLSTDTEAQDGEAVKERVTLSTCHAAKGLEWPVVLIPAVEQGTFPSTRADDEEEERRLLYVACTRAQGLLYITHAKKRMIAGETKNKYLSPFICAARQENYDFFATQPRNFTAEDRKLISTVCGRELPDEEEVQKGITEFNKKTFGSLLQYNRLAWEDPISVPQENESQDLEGHAENATFDSSETLPLVGFQSTASLVTGQGLPLTGRMENLVPRSSQVASSSDVNISTARKPNSTPAPSSTNTFAKSKLLPAKPVSIPTRPSPILPPKPSVKETCVHAAPLLPVKQPILHDVTAASSSSTPVLAAPALIENPASKPGTKRRLGMGRGPVGYFPNKKFKLP